LLLPSLGPNARKTNYDYTKGKLDDLIDVIIEEKTKLFVCAVGVPPKEVVEKLHKAGILVMNVSPSCLLSFSGQDTRNRTKADATPRWSDTQNTYRKPSTKGSTSFVHREEKEVDIPVLRLLQSSFPHVLIFARIRNRH
jgi:hypothetical protein